ncbi:SDR family NAD(P)-dependent oxidoreductase [Microbacterium sp.]|uniref:SDR family NAD(P)-dependent oxidoreductase n=1 Tax=Microbacterium sp. TaxID=51671 RepID=UPI003A881298
MTARTVVVIGGTGAIGQGVCVTLAEQGMTVVVADLRGGSSVVERLPATDARHRAITLDVTDLDAVLGALGPGGHEDCYDAIVYAAGTNYTGPVATTDWHAYDRLLDVNLRGAFHVGQALSRNLAERPRECSAVFFSSTAGLHGESGGAVYCATKFGLVGFTESLASELAVHGGRVNAICPGNVDSPLLRALADDVAVRRGCAPDDILAEYAHTSAFGRLIDIREVAEVTAFLAGPRSTGMSGQTVVVDGPPL